MIAARSEPGPLSAVVTTVKVEPADASGVHNTNEAARTDTTAADANQETSQFGERPRLKEWLLRRVMIFLSAHFRRDLVPNVSRARRTRYTHRKSILNHNIAKEFFTHVKTTPNCSSRFRHASPFLWTYDGVAATLDPRGALSKGEVTG